MPDKGESVVEDVGRVGPRVAGIKHIGSIGFCQLHLHKLGKILSISPRMLVRVQSSDLF